MAYHLDPLSKTTSPRVLGSCDELLSLLELIAKKSTTNFKLQTFTVCFRLNAQTLESISDFYFNFKPQHLTSTLTSYYKLHTSTSNAIFVVNYI